MNQTHSSLGNSSEAEGLLRPTALWAADCADLALSVFEVREGGDSRPREAIAGSRGFGSGNRRDKALRSLAWAAHSAAKESGQQSAQYAARAAMLAAAVAYTHTDLNEGKQGVNQARHILGPAVYAALACEIAAEHDADIADDILQAAANNAPQEVCILLRCMPPQPRGTTRLSQLFHDLDARIRTAATS